MSEEAHSTDQTVTLEMVAREAGVSPSTVSRILNGTARVSDAKRQAVESAIARFNYRPNVLARSLAWGRTFSIGVLTQDIGSPFYGEALRGVEDALANTTQIPIFVSGHWNLKDEQDRMRLLLERRVDGIIVLTGRLPDESLVEYARQVPIVVTGRKLQGPNLQSLSVDNFAGAYAAMRHLLSLGHTRIAHIGGAPDHPDAQERLRGYQQALTDAGIRFDPELVAQADFHEPSGVLAINQLLESRANFTAVFAANDQSAYGASLALYRRNIRIPEDISLVGFDDLPNSMYSMPPLTTVRQPVYDIGKAAAELILKLIDGVPVEAPALGCELVVRESTRRLR